ncbi:LysE family translocator [Nocardiopsis rhodophaea]|uniref:LysE family translocator n=1 Tax=Nocardiopsis rhodophaea TaxID=280238 RepID=A0ABN2TAZ0_9ACTN
MGVALGLGAGLSPGPLLSLVVLSSLRDGAAAGSRLAFAPLLTDLPIALLALTLLSTFPPSVAAALSAVGGLVVIGFGVMSLRESQEPVTASPATPDGSGTEARSPARNYLLRGVIVNMLSPHPWVFWIGVGAPLTVSAAQTGVLAAAAFVIGFYGLLVGSKVVLAAVVGASGRRLSSRGHLMIAVGASVLMIATGVLLLFNALR